MKTRRIIVFFIVFGLFVLISLSIDDVRNYDLFSVRSVIVLTGLMAGLWLTELIPLWATALLPLLFVALVPLRGLDGEPLSWSYVSGGYVAPIIWLFLSTFVLGGTLHKYGIDRWVSIGILKAMRVRTKHGLLVALGLIGAVLSMWMSNTVVTAMLLPIVLVLTEKFRDKRPFLLVIAWASSIGGIATLIGTPPNGITAGFLMDEGYKISFLQWFVLSLPVSAVLLGIASFILTRDVPNEAVDVSIKMGRLSPIQKYVAIFIAVVIMLWLVVPIISEFVSALKIFKTWVIGLLAVILITGIPFQGRRVVNAKEAIEMIDWGILLLFGGGLALSRMMTASGTAQVLANHLTDLLSFLPPIMIVILFALAVNFLTELTSNTATTATLLPILIPVYIQMGIVPLLGALPIAYSASLAFMLPIATPPNAIVYASGELSIPYIARKGFIMNLLGWVVVCLWVLGISWFRSL